MALHSAKRFNFVMTYSVFLVIKKGSGSGVAWGVW